MIEEKTYAQYFTCFSYAMAMLDGVIYHIVEESAVIPKK
jgi:hypothetical protein